MVHKRGGMDNTEGREGGGRGEGGSFLTLKLVVT